MSRRPAARSPWSHRMRIPTWLSAGAVGAARGLNDTPKIAAVVGFALLPVGVPAPVVMAGVASAMAAGVWLGGVQVARRGLTWSGSSPPAARPWRPAAPGCHLGWWPGTATSRRTGTGTVAPTVASDRSQAWVARTRQDGTPGRYSDSSRASAWAGVARR